MGRHALLSASSSKRWLSCTPSARLEEQFQEESGGSVYAEEGTAAHALAEHKLKKALKRRSRRPVSDYHCDEMEECTDGYVAFAMEQVELARQECSDPVVLIEQRLDYSAYVCLWTRFTLQGVPLSLRVRHILTAPYLRFESS